MSISRRILKLVLKSLPHLSMCNDVLVLPPTGHILRGYGFERTPYKAQFYLWRVVMPLYRPTKHLHLSYSERIPRGALVELPRDDLEHAARFVTEVIAEDLPILDKFRDVEDFLNHISWMIGNTMPYFLLDLGLTYCMLGKPDMAVEPFEQLELRLRDFMARLLKEREAMRKKKSVWPRQALKAERSAELAVANHRLAADLVAQLKSDPAKVNQTISIWERENIARLNLIATMDIAPTVT
jgi:hypothetical protein